jgi:NTP pyrophosphatase (non-canonical NTP hydrolase)
MSRHQEVCDYVKTLQSKGWECGNIADGITIEVYKGVTLDHENKLYYYVEDNGPEVLNKELTDPYNPTMEELSYLLFDWAKDKGIMHRENSGNQMLKVMEEIGETASALAKNDIKALEDGIGDSMVTLIILSHQMDLNPSKCLQTAWEEIRDRTGKTKNGVFIKD